MNLTTANAKILESAIRVHNLICHLTPHKELGRRNTRELLFLGACDLVFEHHGAILHLLRTGQSEGSALALLRPIMETRNRAFWVKVCATDEQIEAITQETQEFPSLAAITSEIEKAFEGTGGAGKFTLLRKYRNELHGFTHSGMQQLKFRFDNEWTLKPNYPESVIAHLISASTSCAANTAAVFYAEIDETAAGDLIVQAYNEGFAPSDPA